MNKLNTTLFYTIEKAIKTYRQFAQKQLRLARLKITIDQWLIIKSILDNPEIQQQEIADKVFKDNASVTRIISLLVKAKYLKRTINKTDKRRSNLEITMEGKKVIKEVYKVVLNNRQTALQKINEKDIKITQKVLSSIIHNCG
jgi:DNA-binding MarR family transcriptional regulator